HDEGAVAHSVDLRDAPADRRAEHHEIQGRREHRRNDALRNGTPGARHLEIVNRPDRAKIHLGLLTRLTKISSSELWRVCRSLKRIPASPRSFSNAVIPVRSPCVS